MTLQSNERWLSPEKVSAKELSKYKGVGKIGSQLLHQRGVSPAEAKSFLNPSLEDIPSFKKLFNSKKAAIQILEAVGEGKKIYIHGDYDVDGISATALMWEFLYKELAAHLGKSIDVLPYIPDRIDEGYGLSPSSIDAMVGDGAELVITVDCGIRDGDTITKYSKKNSIDFIVTDHHQPPADIEKYKHTIVHQMYPKKEYPEQKICGSAVAFLLIQAIKDAAGMDSKITESTPGLDLVGLASISDMMPLTGVNRVFVNYGLEQMKKGVREGLNALIRSAEIDGSDLDSYHLGFMIGPRINAAGRIGSAMDALRLLLSENKAQVSQLAGKLHNLNVRRQENTSSIIFEAQKMSEGDDSNMMIFVHGKGWHEGIIGLVAGRLAEKFRKPVVVATELKGEIKGSARSFPSFNITEALEAHSEQLEKYGGHAQAAGFSIKPEKLEKFKEDLVKFANEKITPDMLTKELELDLDLDVADLTEETLNEIETLKPFGYGNPRPLISLMNAEVTDKFEMSGGKHMKLTVEKGEAQIKAVMFNCDEDVEKISVGQDISIAGHLNLNVWNGNSEIQLQVKGWK